MPRLQAQRTLEQVRLSDRQLTAAGAYNLTLAATESEDLAWEARNAVIAAELRAGRTPQ